MITKNDAFSSSTSLEAPAPAKQTASVISYHFYIYIFLWHFFLLLSFSKNQSKRIIRTIFIWFNFVNVIFMAHAAPAAKQANEKFRLISFRL